MFAACYSILFFSSPVLNGTWTGISDETTTLPTITLSGTTVAQNWYRRKMLPQRVVVPRSFFRTLTIYQYTQLRHWHGLWRVTQIWRILNQSAVKFSWFSDQHCLRLSVWCDATRPSLLICQHKRIERCAFPERSYPVGHKLNICRPLTLLRKLVSKREINLSSDKALLLSVWRK